MVHTPTDGQLLVVCVDPDTLASPHQSTTTTTTNSNVVVGLFTTKIHFLPTPKSPCFTEVVA